MQIANNVLRRQNNSSLTPLALLNVRVQGHAHELAEIRSKVI